MKLLLMIALLWLIVGIGSASASFEDSIVIEVGDSLYQGGICEREDAVCSKGIEGYRLLYTFLHDDSNKWISGISIGGLFNSETYHFSNQADVDTTSSYYYVAIDLQRKLYQSKYHNIDMWLSPGAGYYYFDTSYGQKELIGKRFSCAIGASYYYSLRVASNYIFKIGTSAYYRKIWQKEFERDGKKYDPENSNNRPIISLGLAIDF